MQINNNRLMDINVVNVQSISSHLTHIAFYPIHLQNMFVNKNYQVKGVKYVR